VLNAEGRVVASTRDGDLGGDWSASDLFARTRRGEGYQGTVATSADDGRMSLTFAQPIRAAYDRTGIGTGRRRLDEGAGDPADVSLNGARQDADHVGARLRGDGGILYQTR
jgi:hypothetical protein